MRYIQYYEKSTVGFVEAMGDRSIVILDARNSLETACNDAEKFNGYRRPHYQAFQIRQGESILRSNPITDVVPL